MREEKRKILEEVMNTETYKASNGNSDRLGHALQEPAVLWSTVSYDRCFSDEFQYLFRVWVFVNDIFGIGDI